MEGQDSAPRGGDATPEQRKAVNMQVKREEKRRAGVEAAAMKQVAEQINETAKLAVMTLRELILGKIQATQLVARDAALLVIKCDDGKELRDDVAQQIMHMMKMPLIVVPKSMDFSALSEEDLAAVGLQRKPKIELAT